MKRIWQSGKLVKGNLAVSPFDRGLTLGDGLFETIAVTDGVPLWRFEHVQRLLASARELGIPIAEDDLENAIDALTHKAKGSHVLRLTLTRGEVARGLGNDGEKPLLAGTLQPFDVSLRFQPAKLITASARRNLHSPASRMKTLSYMDNILAAREAAKAKADDALMLNSAGRIACTTVGNVFLVVDDALITPPPGEGILPGIMRGAVMAAARLGGFMVRERTLKPTDVAAANGLFLTNSLRFLRPVSSVDGKRLRASSRALKAVTKALLESEQEQVMMG